MTSTLRRNRIGRESTVPVATVYILVCNTAVIAQRTFYVMALKQRHDY